MTQNQEFFRAVFEAVGIDQMIADFGKVELSFNEIYDRLKRLQSVPEIDIKLDKAVSRAIEATQAMEKLAATYDLTVEDMIRSDKKLQQEQKEFGSGVAIAGAENKLRTLREQAEGIVANAKAAAQQAINDLNLSRERAGTAIGLGRDARASTGVIPAGQYNEGNQRVNALLSQAEDAERQMLNAMQARNEAIEKGLVSESQLANLNEQVTRAARRRDELLEKSVAELQKEVDTASQLKSDVQAKDARRTADEEIARLARQEAEVRRRRVADLEAAFSLKPGSVLYSKENALSPEQVNSLLGKSFDATGAKGVDRAIKRQAELALQSASVQEQILKAEAEALAGTVAEASSKKLLAELGLRRDALNQEILRNDELISIATRQEATAAERSALSTRQKAQADFLVGFRGVQDNSYAQQIGQAFKFSVFYGTAYKLLFAFTQTLQATLQEGIQFQQGMTDLAIATGRPKSELTDLGERLASIATDTGASPQQGPQIGARAIGIFGATKASDAQQDQIAETTARVVSRLAVGSGKQPIDILSSVGAIAQALGLGSSGTYRIADLDAYFTKRFGAAQGSTLDALGASASIGKAAGFSDEELFAMAASIVGKTGQTPSAVGGYLAQLFSRGGQGALNEVEARHGIDQTKPLADQLRALADAYKNATPIEQSTIAASLGRGKSQNALVAGFLGSFDDIKGAIKDARTEAPGSADEQFNERMKDIGGRIILLSGQFKELAHLLGESGLLDLLGLGVIVLTEFLRVLNAAISLYNELGRPIRDLISGIALFALALRVTSRLRGTGEAAAGLLTGIGGASTEAATAIVAGGTEIAAAESAVAAEILAAGGELAAAVVGGSTEVVAAEAEVAAAIAIAAGELAADVSAVAALMSVDMFAAVNAAAESMGLSAAGLQLATEQRLIAEGNLDRVIATAAIERLTADHEAIAAQAEVTAAISIAGTEMASSLEFLAATFGLSAEAVAAGVEARAAAEAAEVVAIAEATAARVAAEAAAADVAAAAIVAGGATIAEAETVAAGEVVAGGAGGGLLARGGAAVAGGAAAAGTAAVAAAPIIALTAGVVALLGVYDTLKKQKAANDAAATQQLPENAPGLNAPSTQLRAQADVYTELAKQQRDTTGGLLGKATQLITLGHANDESERSAKALELEAERLRRAADIAEQDRANLDPARQFQTFDKEGITTGLEGITANGGSATVQLRALDEAINGLGETAAASRNKIRASDLATGVGQDLFASLQGTDFGGGHQGDDIIKKLREGRLSNTNIQKHLGSELKDLGISDYSQLDSKSIGTISRDISEYGTAKLPDSIRSTIQHLLQDQIRAALERAKKAYDDALSGNSPLTAAAATGAAEEFGKIVDARSADRPASDFKGRIADARTKLQGYRRILSNVTDGGDTSQLRVDIQKARDQLASSQIDQLEALRKVAEGNAKSDSAAAKAAAPLIKQEIKAAIALGSADQLARALSGAGPAYRIFAKNAVKVAQAAADAAAQLKADQKYVAAIVSRTNDLIFNLLDGDYKPPPLPKPPGVVHAPSILGNAGSSSDVIDSTPSDYDSAGSKEDKPTAAQIAAARKAAEAARRGGQVGPAKAALAVAKAELDKAEKGTIEYYNALASYYQAQDSLRDAIRNYAHIRAELRIDTTDPLAEARLALQVARNKLLSDIRKGKAPDVIAQDRLDLKNAQNAAEQTKFDQRLSDVQTAEELGRITHGAYLNYLQSEHNRLTAIAHKTRQQQDELNQIDRLIKDANEQLQGSFNIGDIKLPTPYEVRRYLQTQTLAGGIGASTGPVSGTTTIYIDGADTAKVKAIIDDTVGKSSRVVTTTIRRS